MKIVMTALRKTVPARWRITILLLILGAIIVKVTVLDDSWLRLALAGGDSMGVVAKERDARLRAERAERARTAIESSENSAKHIKP